MHEDLPSRSAAGDKWISQPSFEPRTKLRTQEGNKKKRNPPNRHRMACKRRLKQCTVRTGREQKRHTSHHISALGNHLPRQEEEFHDQSPRKQRQLLRSQRQRSGQPATRRSRPCLLPNRNRTRHLRRWGRWYGRQTRPTGRCRGWYRGLTDVANSCSKE